MEDMILVTGRYLTKSWVNVAFNQRRPDAGVSFNAYVSRDSGFAHFHVSTKYETPGYGLTRARIYVKINAYSFEGSVSLAS
jgi:hypothetical protein